MKEFMNIQRSTRVQYKRHWKARITEFENLIIANLLRGDIDGNK